MPNLNRHQFHQALVDFAQQQLNCEYDCGQKIVRVNIDHFIDQLLQDETIDANNKQTVVAKLKAKWGISEEAIDIICYIPTHTTSQLKTGNIIPLQFEMHHHFSLIANATKAFLSNPSRTEETSIITQAFYTFFNYSSSSASHSNCAFSSADLALVDNVFEAMMLEINIHIMNEVFKFLTNASSPEHAALIEAYLQYLTAFDKTTGRNIFYRTLAKFNASYESCVNNFLNDPNPWLSPSLNSSSSNNDPVLIKRKRISVLNKKLDELRDTIASHYYIYYLHELTKKGLFLDKNHIRRIERNLPTTPADRCDKLIQNSTTGAISYLTQTQYTAHDKQLSTSTADGIAIRQVVAQYMLPHTMLYRLPSLAATDAEEAKATKYTINGNNSEIFFHDVATKFQRIQDRIFRDLLAQADKVLSHNDVIYYNLLTSYGTTTGLSSIYDQDEASTHQNWSTEIIVEGLHRKNKLGLADKSPLFLLCNLAVNDLGISTSGTNARSMAKGLRNHINHYLKMKHEIDDSRFNRTACEIFALAELSILDVLSKKLPKTGTFSSLFSAIARAAQTEMASYKKYVEQRKNGELFYESAVYKYNKSSTLIAKKNVLTCFSQLSIQNLNDILGRLNTKAEKTQCLLSLALAKIFANNQHLHAKNGMLVQSFLVALQDSTITGCKSANERFANVQGLAEAVYHDDFQGALSSFIIDYSIIAAEDNEDYDIVQEKTSIDKLYDTLAIVFSDSSSYLNAGQTTSFSDQGSGPKTKQVDRTLLPNSNNFVNSNVNIEQSQAGGLQAHKMAKHKELCEALTDLATEHKALTKIVTTLHEQYLIIAAGASKKISTPLSLNSRDSLLFTPSSPTLTQKTFSAQLSELIKFLNAAEILGIQALAGSHSPRLPSVATGRETQIISPNLRGAAGGRDISLTLDDNSKNPIVTYKKITAFNVFLNENHAVLQNAYTTAFDVVNENIHALLALYEQRFPHYVTTRHNSVGQSTSSDKTLAV